VSDGTVSGEPSPAEAGAGIRGGSDETRREGGGLEGGGAHGDPAGMGPRGPDGPDSGAPGAAGGADTDAAGGADTDAADTWSSVGSSTGGVAPDVPAPLPADPLDSWRIGDGRRVRNHADSTARKMGSSIVSSGRGIAVSPPLTGGPAAAAADAAAGSQSSRTRGISSVMSRAGENPLGADEGPDSAATARSRRGSSSCAGGHADGGGEAGAAGGCGRPAGTGPDGSPWPDGTGRVGNGPLAGGGPDGCRNALGAWALAD
jgi:hypothetical protein